MNYDSIHETAIADIMDTIKDGVKALDATRSRSVDIRRAGSLAQATAGLNLVFPVLVDRSLPIETAAMVTKAVERKMVTLLQTALAAANITGYKDATQWLALFHTNINKLTVDDFIGTMDSLVKENAHLIPEPNKALYEAVTKDIRNLTHVFSEDVKYSSVNEFATVGTRVIKEERKYASTYRNVDKSKLSDDDRQRLQNLPTKPERPEKPKDYNDHMVAGNLSAEDIKYNSKMNLYNTEMKEYYDDLKAYTDWADHMTKQKQFGYDVEYQNDRDKIEDERAQVRQNIEKAKSEMELIKSELERREREANLIRNQLMSTDVKKANELVPTMLVVNFVTKESEEDLGVARQIVIGVKAKMYEISSHDTMNKLITLKANSNSLLGFIKATTREISFVKDFLLAIDDAKLNAVTNSKRGSNTNKILKTLERRALGGKIRKSLKLNNACKAITTLVISREVADQIIKEGEVNVDDVKVMRKMMEKLNIIMFIIADDASESIKTIMDTGDDIYETISYTNLEREASDSQSKKAINLMTKLAR